jgi:hypothetical protein
MMMRTKMTRMTSRRMLDLEAELKPMLAKAIQGAASAKELERIQTIFALCRQANKLEQYRLWREQVKANACADATQH